LTAFSGSYAARAQIKFKVLESHTGCESLNANDLRLTKDGNSSIKAVVKTCINKVNKKPSKETVTLQMSKTESEALKEFLIGLWITLEFDAR